MTKLQRIMIDGGFTCPNRDGTSGCGGCSYCRNITIGTRPDCLGEDVLDYLHELNTRTDLGT